MELSWFVLKAICVLGHLDLEVTTKSCRWSHYLRLANFHLQDVHLLTSPPNLAEGPRFFYGPHLLNAWAGMSTCRLFRRKKKKKKLSGLRLIELKLYSCMLSLPSEDPKPFKIHRSAPAYLHGSEFKLNHRPWIAQVINK